MTPKEIVSAWYKNIDEQNFTGNRVLAANNHKFHNPMTPEPIGTEEHIGMQMQMSTAFTGTHNIEMIVEEGNTVAVFGRWTGKHTGEFNGVPATGNDVNFTFADFFEIVDGKVANEYFEMNPMAIMGQIGAMESQNA